MKKDRINSSFSLQPSAFILATMLGCATSLVAQPDMSTISIPIRATLAPALPLVEAQVPKSIENSRDQSGFKIKYTVTRDPIALQMTGTELHASTLAHYSIEACRGILGCLSCGVDEPPRDAKIALSARFTWAPDWSLHSVTTAEPATFPNRCEVTALNLDITDRVIGPVVDDQMRKVAAAIDQNTPGVVTIRTNAEQIWTALQAPYEVAARTWLVFEPMDAGLSPLAGEKLIVSSTLSLNARTRVIVGDKPSTTIAPLPALQSRNAPPGFRIAFEIRIGYGDATSLASQQFAGKTFKIGSDDLRIDAIAISPAAAGKLGVDATIAYKQYAGPVHLEGMPRIDPSANTVTVPDLDYALDPAHKTFFLSIVEGAAHDLIRSRLRDAATIPLASHAADARNEITKALTRQLSSGVQLRGQADDIRAENVVVAADAIVARVVVTGIATVEVTRIADR
jgi:hypothetical protein